MANWAMIPAAPASIAGLVSAAPGPRTNSTKPLIWPLSPFSTPVDRPLFELSLSPYFFIALADSSLSFTQRPEFAAISDPACAVADPVLSRPRRRPTPRPVDEGPETTRPSDAR